MKISTKEMIKDAVLALVVICVIFGGIILTSGAA
jgi:hypothetical protein